jgi:Domain of unknown function DUF29
VIGLSSGGKSGAHRAALRKRFRPLAGRAGIGAERAPCCGARLGQSGRGIEGLVRSDRRALKSFLRNALLHLLELAYSDSERDRNQRQWRLHLVNARTEMLAIVEDSPSLERYIAEFFEQSYQAARREAEIVIGAQLPERCDWTVEQVRSDTFYPAPAAVPQKRKR